MAAQIERSHHCSLDSSAVAGLTNSYTLGDIYSRLHAGMTGSQSTFTEPSSGPTAGTMHTLNDIMSVALGEVVGGRRGLGER